MPNALIGTLDPDTLSAVAAGNLWPYLPGVLQHGLLHLQNSATKNKTSVIEKFKKICVEFLRNTDQTYRESFLKHLQQHCNTAPPAASGDQDVTSDIPPNVGNEQDEDTTKTPARIGNKRKRNE